MSDTFILELPLKANPKQEKILLARLEAARQLYNACLGEALKRLKLMRESRAYTEALSIPKGKERTQAFRILNETFAFREYDIHSFAVEVKNSCHIGDHLDVHTCQKVATRAFNAAKEYAFKKRGRPRFKGKNQLDSIEGKSNQSGIRFRSDKILWSGLELPACFDKKDKHGIETHALNCKIKYNRIVRRKIKGENRFFAQLILEGKPRIKHPIGSEDIGLDIGPSTIAYVGDTQAHLELFCAKLTKIERDIRKLQRRLDRSRRAMNPDNYNPDGTVKKGKKTWKVSNRYLKDKAILNELHRKLAATRKKLHGEMANRILSQGKNIYLEKISHKAWQKIFGKSVNFRAPGMFISMLTRKAESAGGRVHEIPLSTRLSQVCHNCGKVEKKPLSKRWHKCECGVTAQRDLYSAFLAKYVSNNCLNTSQAKLAWSGAELLLERAVLRLKQSASGGDCPASFGIRRQSGSHAKDGSTDTKAGDGVAITSTV